MNALRDEYVETLEAENDVLRERISVLEEIIGMKMQAPMLFPLTPQESKLFGVLMKRDLVSKETAMFALYGTRPDGENIEIKIIDVFICKLRAKLKKFGIEISTQWGQGYFMTAEAKDRVRAYVAASANVAEDAA